MEDPAAVVLVLAGELRAHVERGKLAGVMLAPAGGEADRVPVEGLARAVPGEVDECLAFAAGGRGRVHPTRWYELAARLWAIERATHAQGG